MIGRVRGTEPGSPRLPAGVIACAAGAAILGLVAGASGQTLDIKQRPAAASLVCEPQAEAPTCSPEHSEEVDRLIDDATQAMILGDLELASEFLSQALELEPCAAEAAYLRGRIITQTEGPNAATEWFCRYLALEPYGSSAPEARRRLEQAVQDGAGANVLSIFSAGVSRFEAGDLERADELFTTVLDRRLVPEALYNRALTRLALDRYEAARTDLQRYLELRPEGEDQAAVSEALTALAAERSSKSPAAALALGTFLPGAGQYYTGRTLFGLAVTGLVGGVVAGGFLYEETTIQCRTTPSDGECPTDAIAGRETERPLLIPALAVGAGIVLAAAIEAAFHAAGDEPAVTVPLGEVGTLTVDPSPRPTLSSRAVDIHLIRFEH